MCDVGLRTTKIEEQLEEIGVKLMMNTQLVSYDGKKAQLKTFDDAQTTKLQRVH
jgi:hypothetical protein